MTLNQLKINESAIITAINCDEILKDRLYPEFSGIFHSVSFSGTIFDSSRGQSLSGRSDWGEGGSKSD